MKTRWDTVQTMIEAKCALKYMFELVADIRTKGVDTEFELRDIKNSYQEKERCFNEQNERLVNQLKLIETKYSQELAQINRDNEEKLAVLLKHLSTKENITNDEHLKERLTIQAKELERMANLQEEVNEYKEKINSYEEQLQMREDELHRLKNTMETINEEALKKVNYYIFL